MHLVLLFFPILTKSYDYRFVIPAFGPLFAVGALSAWGLGLKVQGVASGAGLGEVSLGRSRRSALAGARTHSPRIRARASSMALSSPAFSRPADRPRR
jgi:hypothetical protein